jgi:hypothetical protein
MVDNCDYSAYGSFTKEVWLKETLKSFDHWPLDNEGNTYDIEKTRQYFKDNATPENILQLIKDHKLWFDFPDP